MNTLKIKRRLNTAKKDLANQEVVRPRPQVEEFSGGKELVYKSDQIYERRRRILRVARQMIFESGLEGVSIRALCARAKVAQRTIYNAFGSKENVIAHAIRQYQADFNQKATYNFTSDTIEGRLERLIKVHARNTQIRPYTTAIMSVYYSATADRSIRNAIRDINREGMGPFCDRLTRERQFSPGVTADSFLELEVTTNYAIILEWCMGDIDDELLGVKTCENFLVLVAGSTRGNTRRDAFRWLEDLRSERPSWLALRTLAAEIPLQKNRGHKAVTKLPSRLLKKSVARSESP